MKHMLLGAALCALVTGATAETRDWTAVTDAARGQTVYWNAWGGSTTTNDFLAWVGQRVAQDYGVTLEHVKLSDTATAVTRVISEKAAGQDTDGAVDMIWINGENFANLKRQGLLFGPFAQDLPNWALVDTEGKPVLTDFTVPTDGYESPWATAQVVFMHDSADIPAPLPSMEAIAEWAANNPGRFTYPQPPDFLGVTFLKQALYDLTDTPEALLQDTSDVDYDAVTAPLWAWLDAVHPDLWRQGKAFPQSGPTQLQLIADDEIDLAMSLSPGEASTAIANYQIPDTVRTFVLDGGTIGNASFVAIPYNSGSTEGAMVVANFLLSPEAQARALDPNVLGYGTVLDVAALPAADQARFDQVDLGIATLSPDALGTALDEPHPSWHGRLEADWLKRYGAAQ